MALRPGHFLSPRAMRLLGRPVRLARGGGAPQSDRAGAGPVGRSPAACNASAAEERPEARPGPSQDHEPTWRRPLNTSLTVATRDGPDLGGGQVALALRGATLRGYFFSDPSFDVDGLPEDFFKLCPLPVKITTDPFGSNLLYSSGVYSLKPL